jgi:hypothetical protein
MLLFAVLACYTPQQAGNAEQRAIAQLDTALETLDYVPPDAVLLAEERASTGFTGIENDYVAAAARRLYGINRSCDEIVTDYESALSALGWELRTGPNCDYPVWLSFYLQSGEVFTIYAEPFEGANIEVAPDVAQRFTTTYFVNFRVVIPIESKSATPTQ